jgi:two-component sensor histidine kinase
MHLISRLLTNNARLCLLFLLCCLAALQPALAQTVPFIKFTREQGLPSDIVYNIFQDSRKFLWFATDKGIARYDGAKFETFTTSDGLPDNEIFGFEEDAEGRIWFIAFNGELCFYKNGVFHNVENSPWLRLPFKDQVNRISRESDSSISFRFEAACMVVNIKGKNVTTIDVGKSRQFKSSYGDRLIDVWKINNNRYKLYLSDAVLMMDTLGNISEVTLLSKKYFSTKVRDYKYSEDGIYDSHRNLVYPMQCAPEREHLVFQLFDGKPWLGTVSGLWVADTLCLLPAHYITAISRDHTGNTWVSTKSGAYLFPKEYEQLQYYADAYTGNVLRAKNRGKECRFITDRGILFGVGNHTPLVSGPDITHIRHEVKFFWGKGFSYFLIRPGSANYQKAKDEKELYHALDLTHYFPGYHHAEIKNVLLAGGNLYFVGINRVLRAGRNFDQIRAGGTLRTVFQNPYSTRIYASAVNSADQSLWLSCVDGLYRINDTVSQRQSQLGSTVFRQFTFVGNKMVGLTAENDILIFHSFDRVARPDTLEATDFLWEHFYNIDPYRLLISTNRQYHILSFDSTNSGRFALRTIEYPFVPQQSEALAADEHYTYFFKDGRVTVVATPVLLQQPQSPVPYFDRIVTSRREYFFRPKIKLSYAASKSVRILFGVISLQSKQVQSQYSITRNKKDEWRDITGNEINLNTPGYGTYVVKIRSKTLSSSYSEPIVLLLEVGKPFWATWWFLSLAVVLLAGLIWFVSYWISARGLRKRQRENEADLKYQKAEYKALNALMNPHFIFNSLNNIQALINKEEKRTANQYLVIFSDLIRQNMANTSKGFISLQQELLLVENYLNLEKLRFKDYINYEILIEEEIDTEEVIIPPLLIQPLVENAVKHGLLPKQSTDSKVRIHVLEEGGWLLISIEDNGIGLSKSRESKSRLHESFGLVNLQQRIEHLKKIHRQNIDITVEETYAQGKVTGSRSLIRIAWLHIDLPGAGTG